MNEGGKDYDRILHRSTDSNHDINVRWRDPLRNLQIKTANSILSDNNKQDE